MAATPLVDEVSLLSERMAEALRVLPSRELWEHAQTGEDANDFLFEVKVLFSLLAHLSTNGWAISIENLQDNQIKLPRGPGKKSNFTYFRISHPDHGEWHLVHGTEIMTIVDITAAPDLSLQEPEAGMEPHCGQVKAIWDAKLRGKDGAPKKARVTSDDYRNFVWVRDKLRIPRPGHDAPLDSWPPAFEVSSLITNGRLPTGTEKMFLEDGVSVVQYFENARTSTSPSREQHLRSAVITKP